ncbi:ECF transporter S component [uncultured Sphaerochaeta sp.]|uniref:ECF transporter S component n=1 Tax=uncultured Sphaerochaeta sp. TaxID=886478 RepID=UPI0029CAA06C|nr:ECF transporter S component [uncultured Sphaerochaeta sp.]
MQGNRNALKVAMVSVLTAVVVVFTMVVRIPTAKGYLNLCDVAICFIAFTFGPWSAFIAAGLGTALADLISGYAQWAPISFVVHGVEGLLVALIVQKKGDVLYPWEEKPSQPSFVSQQYPLGILHCLPCLSAQ